MGLFALLLVDYLDFVKTDRGYFWKLGDVVVAVAVVRRIGSE